MERTIPIGFEEEHCFSCHIIFFVTADFQKKRIADKQNFFCPKGHQMHYIGKTVEAELRERIVARDEEIARKDREIVALTKKRRVIKRKK